jgi:hypothetical protein
MKKTNKFKYLIVIQQYFGTTWEDSSEYECNSNWIPKEVSTIPNPLTKRTESLLAHDLREYKLMGYPTRTVRRKIANNEVQN